MKTKCIKGEFKGHKTLTIAEVKGEDLAYTIITLGKRKIEAILNHVDDLKEFLEKEGGENEN